MNQWIYVAHNRNNKWGQVAINKEWWEKLAQSIQVHQRDPWILSLSSVQPKQWPLPCVISVMLDALRFKSINNKVNDYHMCPVIDLPFLPWRKLSCSLLLWSSNLSSSHTEFWRKIAKPLQYGILWEKKPWQLRHLAPSKLRRQPLPTQSRIAACSKILLCGWSFEVPLKLSLYNLFLFYCNSSLICTPLIQNFT